MAVFYCWIICLSAAFSLCIAVDICSNGTESGSTVILTRTGNTKDNCGCVLLLTGKTGTNVTFSGKTNLRGCQYKLVYDFTQNKTEYHCRHYTNIPNQYLNPRYNYTVKLEKYENTNAGFEFFLEMATESNNSGILTISCSTSDKPILPDSTSTFPIPSDKPTTILSKTTTDHNTPTTDHNTPTTDQAVNGQTARNDIEEKSDSLAVIIGCSVSGVVLISIVIIAVVVYFLKRRKEKTRKEQRLSEQNISGGPIYSGCYEDVSNLTTQNENKDTGYAVTFSQSIDNDLNDLDDYDHLPEPKHVPVQPNHVSAQPNHVSTQLNHAPKHLNHVPAQPNHVRAEPNHVPDTSDEYAVVDKKPKKVSKKSNVIELNNKSKKVKVNEDYENIPKDKLNLKREIDRIVGPKGDEYTLVNKC